MTRRAVLQAAAVLALSWAAIFLVWPWADTAITDLPYRNGQAEQMLAGALPYRDMLFEYPPLAAPLTLLPALVGGHLDPEYELGLGLLMLVVMAVVVWQCGRLAERTRGSPRTAMLAAAASPLLLGAIVRMQFDLVPTAMLIGALMLLVRGSTGAGAAWLGAGVMTKAFPLVAAPPALGWLLGAGRRSDAVRGAVAFAAVVAVITVAGIALSATGVSVAARYQLERPVQVESTQATVVRALSKVERIQPEVGGSHGSVAVAAPSTAPVGLVFLVLQLASFAAFTWLAVRAGHRAAADPAESGAAMCLAAFGCVVAFVAFGRVISPQYLVWIVPLVALAASWREWAVCATGAFALLLTLVEFPRMYPGVVDGDRLALIVVGLRNLALVALVAMCLAALRRRERRPAAEFG
ncbi:MAG: hypothetical protein QOG62_1870 [Thermoleophilaceae bacterium]|nr:hypothetical protein [Thermoleophilaceae bacterium]